MDRDDLGPVLQHLVRDEEGVVFSREFTLGALASPLPLLSSGQTDARSLGLCLRLLLLLFDDGVVIVNCQSNVLAQLTRYDITETRYAGVKRWINMNFLFVKLESFLKHK